MMAAPKCVVSPALSVIRRRQASRIHSTGLLLAVRHFVGGRDLTGWSTETILPHDPRAPKVGKVGKVTPGSSDRKGHK